ncbi:MAG: transglutaminase domain-containing protein [Candidatus Altiarchaeota archaeon]|nr:transglutaminase domain-containing protein [Candidatus Altiarchaeota archaeon]
MVRWFPIISVVVLIILMSTWVGMPKQETTEFIQINVSEIDTNFSSVEFEEEAPPQLPPEPIITFTYNGTTNFYVEGDYRGFGSSLELKKLEVVNGTNLCLDIDFNNLCDLEYYIPAEDVSNYGQINLIGTPTHYGEKIRSDLVTEYMSQISISNISDFSAASSIWSWLRTYFHYAEDQVNFGIGDYWSWPNETLALRRGDCEDWTTTFLSILDNARPSAKCYGLLAGVPTGHVFAMCNFDHQFYIFDQGFRKSKDGSAAYLIRDYAGVWGIENITVYSAFDATSTVRFKSNQEFADWMETT